MPPEVEQHHLPAIIAQLELRAIEVFRFNLRGRLADHQEAENTLTEMSKKYADNFALGGQFKDALFMLRTLSLGKTAPEIEAEDLDGKKFKLSDYRGKVVVLDFWGHW